MAVVDPQTRAAGIGFSRTGAAEPRTVVAWRADFTAWLVTAVALDDERCSDVVLAVDEALSNAAEFAYDGVDGGSMSVDAQYSVVEDRLDVTIADQGRWREPDATNRTLARGRGIPLMSALADELVIDHDGQGTVVFLAFARCVRRNCCH